MRMLPIIGIWIWLGWALFKVSPVLGVLYVAVFAAIGALLFLNAVAEVVWRFSKR